MKNERPPKTRYARVKIMDHGMSAAEFLGHVCCVYFQLNPSARLKQSLVICPRLLNVNATVINWSQIKHTALEFKYLTAVEFHSWYYSRTITK